MADHVRHVSVIELYNAPNRLVHGYYRSWFKHQDHLFYHPEDGKGEALENMILGNL